MNIMNKKVKRFEIFINEKYDNKNLVTEFMNHYENDTGINIKYIPKEIINKFFDYMTDNYIDSLENDDELYAGVIPSRRIDTIRSWTTDEDTAQVFAEKYKNGKVVSIACSEFKKIFKNFVSMDVIYDYICKNKLNNNDTDYYVSESEIVILK